jgi:hypothetical protein
MIETKTKIIDGLQFTSTQLPPLKAYPLSARVANILLPALTKFLAADLKLDNVDAFLAQDAAKLMPVLEPLLESLSKKENEDLPQKLLVGTSVMVPDESGQLTVISLASSEGINRAFQGRGMALYKAMWFAVEVNFADFFGGAFKGAQTKDNEKEKASP